MLVEAMLFLSIKSYNRNKEGENMLRKIFIVIVSVMIFLVGTVSYFGYHEYQTALKNHPLDEKIAAIMNQENYVKLDEISPYLLDATIAVEDKRFFTHHGIDYLAYARILYYLLSEGEINSGGSTITQQLSKNLYFTFEPSLTRKVSEYFMAYKIESTYEKEVILEVYLNIINYGDDQMGIGNAAKHYFHKTPLELTFDESTLLAGIPQSPINYQLSNHLDQARIRQQAVLRNLEKNQVYDAEVFKQYLQQVPTVFE